MKFQALVLSLLLLTIISNTDSRSLENSFKCATTCAEPQNIAFTPGYTYQYSYAAAVVSSFHDGPAADQSSEINIRANAMIDVLSHCEMVLRISGASIENGEYVSNENAQRWIDNMERYPMHFNFQDGQIPQVCASNNDPTWVLNIKRGILSALQVSSVETTDAIKETDVTGACESSYQVEGNGQNKEIVKRKNYNSCEDREKHLLFSHFTPYTSESSRQSFIHSVQICTQQIRENQLLSTICEEEHVFRPFSNEESGARTVIRQSLQSSGKRFYYSAATLGITEARRTDLKFENEENFLTSTDSSELRGLFSNLCTTMTGENYEQVGKDFIKMVFLLRRFDSPTIEQVYNGLDGLCPRWENSLKGMFQDALQWCGSEGCVVFATRLIESGPQALPDDVASRWLTGMSLIIKPTLPMLRGLMAVVQSGRLTEQSYLTAGTMIHRLCAASTTSCLSEPVVTRALNVFEKKLGVNCRTTNPEQKQDILMSLRALGNAGRSSAITTLAACAQEDGNDMETRIAAVETFRRMPCNTDRSAMNQIVLDVQQDSEIRIAAYLSVMKCPTPPFIRQVVALLDNEPVQQVASFIWSHMNQILESKDPLKGYMKPLLLEAEFAKQHELDPRKYSRYYEASLYSEALNVGATVESSVVWSPKSFVPRSADLDLTVDVFGQAVNLLEMGGRVEGFEQMIQAAFTSGDFLKNNPLSQLFMPADEDDDDEDDEVEIEEEERPPRRTRETDGARLIEIQNEFKSNLNSENTPKASWYLRVFGNEMYYQNLKSMKQKLSPAEVRSMFAQLAQGGEYQYHDDTMLMNSAHVLPTGLGLPMTIAFNGSASVDVNANGHLDTASYFQGGNLAVEGSLNPRAVILVTGSMSIDAIATKTGIATESSAVSSWTLRGRASVSHGRSVEVRFDAPYNRNTLFSFNHKLMKLNGDEIADIGRDQTNSDNDCSNEFGGQRICVERTPNAVVFPTTGPFVMSTYLEKTDSGFDHYLLEATYHTQYNGGVFPSELQTTLRLDTPNSIVNRETRVAASYNLDQMQFNVNVRSPENNIVLQGSVETEPMRKQISVTYLLNEARTRFQASIQKEHDGNEARWSASTSLERPSKTISASASASFVPTSSISGRLEINNVFATPVVASASLQDIGSANRLQYQGNGQITVPGYVDTGARISIDIRPQSNAFVFGLEYEINGMPPHSINILHKRRDRSTGTMIQWEAEQKMTITQFPHFNHHAQLFFVNGPDQLSSFAKIGLGKHAGHRDDSKYLLVNQTLKYRMGERTEISSTMDIKVPSFDISYNANLSHVHSSSLIDSSLQVNRYRMSFFAQDNAPPRDPMNKVLRVELPTPWGSVTMQDSIQETRRNVYDLRGQVSFGAVDGLTLNGQCNIENLRNRKSFTIEVVDDSDQSFLSARSVFKFQQPTRFSWKTNMQSKYNNFVNLHVHHEGREHGNFENVVLVEHRPNTYVKSTISTESNPEGRKNLAMQVDFKDLSGATRFIAMQVSNLKTISLEETLFNSTVSITNNMIQLPFNSLVGSVEFRASLSSCSVGSSLIYDEKELIGIDGNCRIEKQSNQSVTRSASLILRQGHCNIIPSSVALAVNTHSTLSEGHDVALTYTQDNQEKLTTSFAINNAMTRYEGVVTEQFNVETSPQSLTVILEMLPSGIQSSITYARSSQQIVYCGITKDSQSGISITWSNIDNDFLTFIPQNMIATLQWGVRTKDNGKGIWFDALVDADQPFTAHILYFNDPLDSLSIALEHQVSLYLTENIWIPQVNGKATYQSSKNFFQMESSLLLDDATKYRADMTLGQGEGSIRLLHTLQSLHLPQKIESNARWSWEEQPVAQVFVDIDDSITSASVSATSSLVLAKYFSNCSLIANDFSIEYKKSPDLVTISLSTTQKPNDKRVSVSVSFDKDQGEFVVGMVSQHVSEYEFMQIPAQARLRVTIPSWNEYSFSAQYNDKAIEFNGGVNWMEEPRELAVFINFSHNVCDTIPSFNSRLTVDLDSPFFVSITDRYTRNGQPEKMIQLSFTEDPDSKTRFTVVLRHDETELAAWGIPEDVSLALSVTQLQYGLKGSVVTTVNNLKKEIIAIAKLDPIEQSILLGMEHSVEFLEENGIPRNITFGCRATPTLDVEVKDINFSAFLQLNDNKYDIDASASLQNFPEQSKVEISTEFGHNIVLLYDIGIPLRTKINSNVGYSIMAGDLSGGFSTSSTIFRKMLDEETGEVHQIENHVKSSVDVQLFSWNLAFATSHDFDIPVLPNSFRYEISASGSTTPHLFHKSLAMSVTVDGKTETASFTINYNPTDHSFTVTSVHDVARIAGFGVPGHMSISLRKSQLFNVDLEIKYDLTKKVFDFTFDYHPNRMHFDLLLNHDFDVIVEQIGIPKTVGLEIGMPYSSNNAEFELRYKWGKVIKNTHTVLRWETFDAPSFYYSHHQNITTNSIFPRNLRLEFSSTFNMHGFTSILRIGRKELSIEFDSNTSERTLFAGTVSIRQNYDTERFPRHSEFRSSLSDNNVLDLHIYFDRTLKLHTTLSGTLNIDEKSASIRVENMQQFFDNEKFPVNLNFYVNGSIGDEISTYLSLARDNHPKFVVGFKTGINTETKSGFVELVHAQKQWKKVVPKKVRVEISYISDIVGNQHSLMINSRLGKRRNEITVGSEYRLTDEAMYGSLRYTHNCDQYQEHIPMVGVFNILLEKSSQQLTAQVNVTLDELSLLHSVQAQYNREINGISTSFEMNQDNIYLSAYDIPHTISGKMSFSWENDISALIKSQYGDKTMNLLFSTDQEARAELTISHTWELYPRSINILLSRLEQSPAFSAVLSVDGVQKQIHFSANLNENQGEIRLTHEFEETLLPQSLILRGSYQLAPNYHFTISVTVDGREHVLTAGYNQLDDGFHITSTLLGITRSATFQQNIFPGRFSISIDHNIPELLPYLSGSLGIAGSIATEPHSNVTFSIRRQANTNTFTSQAELDNLRFNLEHDFEFLPIPRSVTVILSGSTDPYSGSVSVTSDGTERNIRGSFDLENMVGNLQHNIPELPLPNSMQISARWSKSPLSGQVSLTINDLDRSISASFDRNAMQGRLQHTIPELDQVNVARDVTVKVNGGMRPLNVELYVLVDGLERRLNVMLDMEKKLLSIYQNIPEIDFLPSNITLSFKGSVKPLNGLIKLTTNGIERSAEAKINFDERLATFAHNIPEANAYIPSRMSLSWKLTKKSAQITAQYTKNDKNQSAAIGFDVYENHIRAHMSHTFRHLYGIPAEITVEISGSIEHKNASIYFSSDGTLASFNAEIMYDHEGWYGGSVEGHHNIRMIRSFPKNLVAMVKGRKMSNVFEFVTNFDGLENYDLNAVLSLQPTLKRNRLTLETTYDHTFNGKSCSVSGSMAAERKNGLYKFMIDGSTENPIQAQVHMLSSIQLQFNDQYQVSFGFESSHNIPKFTEFGIPLSVQNGQISLVIIPESLRIKGEANAHIDDQPTAYSFNGEIQPSAGQVAFNGNVILQDMNQNKGFSGEFSINVQENSFSVRHTFAVSNRNTGQNLRNDNSLLTVVLDGFDVTARLEMNQHELNQLGLPAESEITFYHNQNGNTNTWVLNGIFDSSPINVQFVHRIQSSPFQIHMSAVFDQSLPILMRLSVPTHLSSEFSSTAYISESAHFDYSMVIDSSDYGSMTFTGTAEGTTQTGTVAYELSHNVPSWRQYLRYSRLKQSHSYTISDNDVQFTGKIILDNSKQIGNFDWTFDWQTKHTVFAGQYGDQTFNAEFNNSFTESMKTITLSIIRNEDTLLLLDYKNHDNVLGVHLVNHLYGAQFDISIKTKAAQNGYKAKYVVEVSTGEKDYTTTFTSEAYKETDLTGQRFLISFVAGNQHLDGDLIVAGKAQGKVGKLECSFNNKNALLGLPKKMQISGSYGPQEVHVIIAKGRKSMSFDFTFEKADSNILIEMTFHNNHIKLFKLLNMPQEIVFSFRNSPSVAVTIRADECVVFELESNPRNFETTVRSIANDDLLSISGTYSISPNKLINAMLVCKPIGISLHLNGVLKMFEIGTGNSTLALSLVDNISSQGVYINAFVTPTSVHAEDFLGSISTISTVSVLPFNIRSKYNSTWDERENTYLGEFSAMYNGVEFALEGKFGPKHFSVRMAQPWFEVSPVIALSSSITTTSDGYMVADMRLQWNTNEDSLSVKLRCKETQTSLFHSIQFTRPSSYFYGISDYSGSVFLDMTDSENIQFGVNTDLNSVKSGINVTYTGVLPKVYGTHNLIVDVKQPGWLGAPDLVTIASSISMTSDGTHRSDVRITSQGHELVALRSNCITNENFVSYELIWKQEIFPTGLLRSLITQNSLEKTTTGIHGSTTLRINNLPKMNSEFDIETTGDGDRTNKSICVRVATGPMNDLLGFRTLSFSSWFKSEFDDRQTAPAFSAVLVIDEETYRIECSCHNISGRGTTRLDCNVNVSQPHNLILFGVRIPKETEGSMNVMIRSKGSRVFITYINDKMENPIKIRSRIRFNNRDMLLEINSDVNYGPEDENDEITMRINVARNDNELDYVMTASIQYPEYGINGEVVIGSVNSDEAMGLNAVAKKYLQGEVFTWEVRLLFNKQTNAFELYLDQPDMEAATLRVDLVQVIGQGQQVLRRMASDVTDTKLRFIKGFERTTYGYDMYIGYEVDNTAMYSLHLITEADNNEGFIAIQTKKNFNLDAEVARASIKHVNARLVQIKFSANSAIPQFMQKMLARLDTETARKVNLLADGIVEFLNLLKTIVTGVEHLEPSSYQQIDAAIAKVNALRDDILRHTSTFATTSSAKFDQANVVLEETVRDEITSLLKEMDRITAMILLPFTDVVNQYFEMTQNNIHASFVHHLEPITTLLRKINAGELVIELADEALQNTLKFLIKNGEACLSVVRRPLTELLVVSETELIFNIPLQFEIDHFVPLPSANELKNWAAQTALAIKIDDTMAVISSYTNQYYRAQALLYIPRDELLPPFKGHAFVSGFRHFSTFDKRHFSFTSGCATSHVLAADLRDRNFTVSVSYADPLMTDTLNSLEVMVGNRHVVIFSNYMVEMNGRFKQLPLDLNLLTVTLEGTVIHIRRPEGDMDVACDFTKELCTVDVSPYYFGATAGLAGIYNNEPMDDFTSPSHEIVSTPGDLASSWEVSGTRCAAGNTHQSCDNTVSAACSALFEDLKSPMRSCFPLVDPKEFMNMCRDDMCNTQDVTKTCSAAHAYAYRCNLLGAKVSLPDKCVVCSDVAGNEFDSSQSKHTTITGLDVVLVVEQGSCMSQRSLFKSMRKFFKHLAGSLSKARMRDNRYHLVGYGGPGASTMPNTLTIKNNRFTARKNDLVKALKKIPLSSEQAYADALSAVSYATQLPFRGGAKPVIVLLSCHQCHSNSEVGYANVELQLRKQGIDFHHMPQLHISAGRRMKSVYGFDDTNAFSKGNAVVSSSVVKQNKDDLCVPLATYTGGSVWDATRMGKSDFIAKVSGYIVDRSSTRSRQVCTCAMNDAGVPTSSCTV